MNQVLLVKWGWRFITENEALWRNAVAAKYKLEREDWFTKIVKGGGNGVAL